MQKARLIKSPTKFMAQYFCNGRRMYPLSGLIGFKWKTYSGRYEETAPYDAAWQYIAEHKIPVVWVLRNTLDIIVSDTMHYEQSHDPTVTSFAMTVARNVSKGGSLQLTLAEKLNTMEDAKGKKSSVKGTLPSMRASKMSWSTSSGTGFCHVGTLILSDDFERP